MSILVRTSDPRGLLNAIYKAIDNRTIATWEYDKDGDFTHKPEQWRFKAWLRPKVADGVLKFGLLGNKNNEMTKRIYGLYHGRFIEEVLTHFDTSCEAVTATAQKDESVDNFK